MYIIRRVLSIEYFKVEVFKCIWTPFSMVLLMTFSELKNNNWSKWLITGPWERCVLQL